MRATQAYIASAGTAAVMLGASVVMLVLVSTFVAFGSWPGSESGTQLDQVVLRDVKAKTKAQPKPVAVRANAVALARRVEARRQVAAVRRGSGGRSPSTTPGGTVPAGTPVAKVPSSSTPQGAASPTGPASATKPVQQTQPATQQLQNTAQQVQQGVQNTTQPVQQQVQNTTQQVGEVVDQVIGGTAPQTSTTVTQVTNAVGGVLGK